MEYNPLTDEFSSELDKELNAKEQEVEWLMNSMFTEKLKAISILLRSLLLQYKENNLWETVTLAPKNSGGIGDGSASLVGSTIIELILNSQKSSSNKHELVTLKFKPRESYVFPQLVNLVRYIESSISLIENITQFSSPMVAIELVGNLKKKLADSVALFSCEEAASLHPIAEIDQNCFINGLKENRIVDIGIINTTLYVNVFNIQPNNVGKLNEIFSTLTSNKSSGNAIFYKNEVYRVRYETNLHSRLDNIAETLDILSISLESCELMLKQISYLI